MKVLNKEPKGRAWGLWQESSGWVIEKSSSPGGWLGSGTGSPGQWSQHQGCWSSRSTWTRLSDTWSDFWVVLHEARGWTRWSLLVPSNLRSSMILFYESLLKLCWAAFPLTTFAVGMTICTGHGGCWGRQAPCFRFNITGASAICTPQQDPVP